MGQLIRFTLERRFLNKLTVLFGILLFLAAGFMCNIDRIASDKNTEIREIYLDSSIGDLREAILRQETRLTLKAGDDRYDSSSAILHYDEGWQLYCENEPDGKLISELERLIGNAVSQSTYDKADPLMRQYIDEFRQKVSISVTGKQEKPKESAVWLMYSLVYFLIMSLSGVLANEVAYEKATHTLQLILTSISATSHFMAKLITGYITLLIQLGGGLLCVGFWGIIRFHDDRFAGLISYLEAGNNEIIGDVGKISLDPASIAVIFLLILMGLLSIQILLMLQAAGQTNLQQAGAANTVFYLLLVIGYYGMLIRGNDDFLKGTVSEILSLLPVSSMIFMPCRMLLGAAGGFQVICSLFTSLLGLWIIASCSLSAYKKRLLTRSSPVKRRLKDRIHLRSLKRLVR